MLTFRAPLSFTERVSALRQRHSISQSVCPPIRRPLHVLAAASLLLAAFGATSADVVQGGFEIHRQGSSPFAREWSVNLVSATEARCAQFAELCEMVTATQGAAEGAECLARLRPEPFTIIGNPDTNGDFEVIEYHHPGLQKSSVTKRSTRLVQTSVCRLEVLQHEKTTITHYTPRGRKVFTRVINPQLGVQPWRSTTHPRLDAESIDLLREAFSLDSLIPAELRVGDVSIATAPGLSDDRIADKDCRWVHILPMQGTTCMLTEGIGMPINESLSSEFFIEGEGGPVVMLRDEVVLFKGPVDLPAAVFEADETATDTTREYTATDAWCEREATRTGIDPCMGDGDDEITDHFDELIVEWCADEAVRTGGDPCGADAAAYPDTRVMQSMSAWCAREAQGTGINRCKEYEHAYPDD